MNEPDGINLRDMPLFRARVCARARLTQFLNRCNQRSESDTGTHTGTKERGYEISLMINSLGKIYYWLN